MDAAESSEHPRFSRRTRTVIALAMLLLIAQPLNQYLACWYLSESPRAPALMMSLVAVFYLVSGIIFPGLSGIMMGTAEEFQRRDMGWDRHQLLPEDQRSILIFVFIIGFVVVGGSESLVMGLGNDFSSKGKLLWHHFDIVEALLGNKGSGGAAPLYSYILGFSLGKFWLAVKSLIPPWLIPGK